MHTTQDVSAQWLRRTTPRTHACQVKVQKKKSTTLNFGDLVDHPPLHPGYLHKMFYPLTASFSLSPSSCPTGSARSIPSLTSYGPETCQSVSSDGIAPKLASPPRRPIFSPTLAFPIGSLFGHFLANSFPTTSSSSFLSSATFRPPGPLPQHFKDNITPLVYEQLLIAQNVFECAISTSTSTSASKIESSNNPILPR